LNSRHSALVQPTAEFFYRDGKAEPESFRVRHEEWRWHGNTETRMLSHRVLEVERSGELAVLRARLRASSILGWLIFVGPPIYIYKEIF
jgi:hypothetical protein